MATIRSQMVLNDGMSAILKKITHVLDFTIHSFEDMKRASGEAFDPAIFQATYAEIGQINEQMDKMERYYIKAAQNQDRFNKGLLTGTGHATGLTNQIGKIAAAAGAAFGVRQLFNLSDQMTSNTARLNLIVDDGGSVEALEAKIMASAQRSRAAYLDTASAIASMGANAGAAFSGNDELIAFMEQVNKQFVIGGASAQGQSAAMLQLTQAMAAGALRGEELNSILENAPGIARAIESYMGIAEGSIKQYAQEGAITAEVVKNALFAAADETNAKFESMPMTWGQIWTSMQNRALTALGPVLTKLNGIANSEQFSTVADSALQAFSVIASVATVALDAVFGLGAAIVDNWSWISPIVWGIVAALVAYGGYLAITSALEAASNIQKGLSAVAAYAHAAATDTETRATFAATAAQYGFNAALLASPVTWIVVGVIALVAGMMALCNWIAKTTGVAQTGFGVLTGGINVVIQAVVNAGLVAANIALSIWNALGAVCSNIGTAFHNVIANVQSWFYGLLSTALTVVAGICEALNKLPFVEFDYSGITSKADEYAAKSAEAANSKDEYTSVANAFSEGFGTFDAYSEGWASDAFQAGAAWGDSVADAVGGMFDGLGYEPGIIEDFANQGFDSFAMDGLGNDVGEIADNTDGMAHALEVSGEELEYLRDIAERDAINRFTTAEVKIDMTGMTNKIDSSNDLDGVIRELTDGFSEALVTAAEGVHE